VNESLIYVRPLYLRSPDGRIPELKRVVVAYQNRIVMAETLTLGLVQIFGPSLLTALAPDRMDSGQTGLPAVLPAPGVTPAPQGPPRPGDTSTDALVRELQARFNRMIAAQKAGDWATYGEEQKALGELLDRLGARRPGSTNP
jgi:uncharacterized membrane protein (UPF0182 family)